MVGCTSTDGPKRVEEDRVPDMSALSLGCPQALSDAMGRAVNLLEFCLCYGGQVLKY